MNCCVLAGLRRLLHADPAATLTILGDVSMAGGGDGSTYFVVNSTVSVVLDGVEVYNMGKTSSGSPAILYSQAGGCGGDLPVARARRRRVQTTCFCVTNFLPMPPVFPLRREPLSLWTEPEQFANRAADYPKCDACTAWRLRGSAWSASKASPGGQSVLPCRG